MKSNDFYCWTNKEAPYIYIYNRTQNIQSRIEKNKITQVKNEEKLNFIFENFRDNVNLIGHQKNKEYQSLHIAGKEICIFENMNLNLMKELSQKGGYIPVYSFENLTIIGPYLRKSDTHTLNSLFIRLGANSDDPQSFNILINNAEIIDTRKNNIDTNSIQEHINKYVTDESLYNSVLFIENNNFYIEPINKVPKGKEIRFKTTRVLSDYSRKELK
ncbi:hypothetical protein [Mammaliicoccus lentus]|jgi:hypothetical protein|uniref:hypothetical protein n=1 Tax=Mammaliicoccus lentus TaxID=42858 RepID=UPI00351141B9